MTNELQTVIFTYMMRQTLFRLLYPVLLFFLAFAPLSCKGKVLSPETIRLTIWTVGSEGNKISLIAQDFERANPDITLDIVKMDWEVARDRILSAINDGGTPDLCQIGTTWTAEFAATETLAPLDNFVFMSSELSKENFFNGPWQTNVIDGKLYGIPWYFETRLLFYRKDLLKAKGIVKPPQTWEELRETAQLLTEDQDEDGQTDTYGLSLSSFDAKTIAPFVWQNGGSLFNSTLTATTLCGKREREALRFYINLFRDGYVLPKESDAIDSFLNGRCAMTIAGPWYVTILRKELSEKSYLWGMATLPKKVYGTSYFGGSNFVMFNSCKNKEGAWRFLEFLSRPENQASWFQAVSALPAVKAAWEKPTAFTNPIYIKIFENQLQDVKTFSAIPQIERIMTTLEKNILDAIDSEEEIDTMLDKLCEEVNSLIQP